MRFMKRGVYQGVIPGQNSVDRVGWRIMSREVGELRTVSEL